MGRIEFCARVALQYYAALSPILLSLSVVDDATYGIGTDVIHMLPLGEVVMLVAMIAVSIVASIWVLTRPPKLSE